MDNRREDSWHLDKKVNITNLFMIISLAGGVIVSWGTIDKRVSILEQYPKTHLVIHEMEMSKQDQLIGDMKSNFKEIMLEMKSHRKILMDMARSQ